MKKGGKDGTDKVKIVFDWNEGMNGRKKERQRLEGSAETLKKGRRWGGEWKDNI